MAESYNGKQDAIHILEKIMKRKRWTVDVRDDLAEFLQSVERGDTQKNKPSGRNNYRRN